MIFKKQKKKKSHIYTYSFLSDFNKSENMSSIVDSILNKCDDSDK